MTQNPDTEQQQAEKAYNWPLIYGGVVGLLVAYIAIGFLITSWWT